MLPNVNPRQMQQMMRRMGINQEELDATQVIIRTPSKTIYIDNPSVSRINAMGQVSFQVAGEERVEEVKAQITVSDDDVATVVSQTGKTAAEAKEAILKSNGDLAAAILSLSGE